MRVRDWTLQYSLLWASLATDYGDCPCPEGYTSNGEECVKISTLPTEQPPTFTALEFTTKALGRYSVYGTMIFNPGYNLDGTSQAGYTYLDTTNFPFWGNPWQNLIDGPMNRSAIWTKTYYSNQEIGFAVCINIPVSRTYLVGYGVDNYLTLRLDGEPVIQMVPQEIASTFNYYRIYPVTIKKGIHVLEIIAYNKTSVAAIGAEIYDATPAQLMACQSQADLDPLTVFSTRQMVGLYTNLGSNGYPVMPGYALVLCDGTPPYYRKVEYSPCLENV